MITKAVDATSLGRAMTRWLAWATALLLATAAVAEPYGQIGSFTAKPGRGAALGRILLDGSAAMPGCRSYVVAIDVANPDKLWVTEVWDSKASHDASLKLPQVRAAIGKALPLIAGMGHDGAETNVIGGTGIAPAP